jgi:hypothetical protein
MLHQRISPVEVFCQMRCFPEEVNGSKEILTWIIASYAAPVSSIVVNHILPSGPQAISFAYLFKMSKLLISPEVVIFPINSP